MGSGNRTKGVRDSEPEREPVETLDVRPEGEEGGNGCVIVRVERYSTRTLDLDNAYGGLKPLIDSLCASGLIKGDDPSKITLSFQQFKVAHHAEKKTVIKIRYPR